jgi:hypothetical protein
MKSLVYQNQLEARLITGGPIATNETKGAFGYGLLKENGNVSLVSHTHRGILYSETQSSAEGPTWHNHFVRLGNVEHCEEDIGAEDINWQSPGEVRIDHNNATISQIPTNGLRQAQHN